MSMAHDDDNVANDATTRCSNEACGATHSSCWYGKRPHKYCKRAACIALGKELGHIRQA